MSAQQHYYWDNPENFSPKSGSFPASAQGSEFSVIGWQESVSSADNSGISYISIAVSKSPKNPDDISNFESEDTQTQNAESSDESEAAIKLWNIYNRVAGPYAYALVEPSFFNITIDKKDRIIICVASTPDSVDIFISSDRGEHFSKSTLTNSRTITNTANADTTVDASNTNETGTASDVLAPKIFCMNDGSLVMFVVRSVDGNLTLFYSHSVDGIKWDVFKSFVTHQSLSLNFLPTHISLNNVDYIVFQSFISGSANTPSYQLFLKSSVDGGLTWSIAKRITNHVEAYAYSNMSADSFNNERAHISADIENGKPTGNLFLVWERRYGSGIPYISGAVFTVSGEIVGEIMRINSSTGACNNPVSFMYKNERVVFWFDNRTQSDQAYMAQSSFEEGAWGSWHNTVLSQFSALAIFTRALVVQNNMYIFWQEITKGESKIILLAADITAPSPTLIGENFIHEKRVSASSARIKWPIPVDSSGILGYSWTWGQDKDALPKKLVGAGPSTVSTEEFASEDGNWYFTILVCDNAGNWSDPKTITFVRDTTPPSAPLIIPLREDENGYILSNTFTMHWRAPGENDLAGYAWSMDYLGDLGDSDAAITASYSRIESSWGGSSKESHAVRIMAGKNETQVSYINRDNGYWCFTVFAIDDVGNVGEASRWRFKMNKYQPHTYITFLGPTQDIQGDLKLIIVGRGYTENGDVQKIYFKQPDKSGAMKTIRTLSLENNDFIIRNDREIFVPIVEHLSGGDYYVYVEHPLRGLAAGASPINLLRPLTVKFGDHTKFWDPNWRKKLHKFFVFDASSLILLFLMIFFICASVFSIRGISAVMSDGRRLQIEILSLLEGNLMPGERARIKKSIKRRGLGLRFKLASFALALVLLVVGMISVPLYNQMNKTQRETLMQGLWDRSVVLLEGITASARVYMPSNSVLELGYLPRQSASVPEANYITITGYGSGITSADNFVWASNDAGISGKINTKALEIGVSRLNDPLNEQLIPLEAQWNKIAQDSVSGMAQSIADYNREGATLVLRDDAKSQSRLSDIQTTVSALEERIANVLTELGTNIGSYPPFNFDDYEKNGNMTYILYKPILFMQGTSEVYVRGTVRLEISTETIIDAMREGRRQILMIILYIALAALAIGVVGSMALAALIVLPIGRLVAYVEKVRDTENKAKLEGDDIVIKSRDEIALLGNTINDMVHGLVKAAKASEDLSLGKEIQKKFIPLELDMVGNKLSSGFKDTKNLQFFGYYEGAKGVSGDYFDYRDIDGRYYAIIKCDVAGKGIPAALIMIQVATMFINYFKDWKPEKNKVRFEKIVYQINDFIEELGFKGRFAAFTLCIFDSQSGEVSFCNAGDNIIHWFDRSEDSMKMLTLPETPATGVLPNIIVESKGGYTTQKISIDHGDILLLYTDGIEEAKHLFRDENYNPIACAEGGAPNDTPHDTHVVGQDGEEMGAPRVEAIINAVMNKQKYTLFRYHTPASESQYHFDFTDVKTDVDHLILAMVSVEKIFRSYKPPDAGEESRVLVDAKIDEFLKKYFVEYDKLFTDTHPYEANTAYVYHTGVKEDEQYDDLTILGVCRK
ncbi:hypothetical protein FACS1894102_4470 [Spirochaetia bacterium]|nr:hypothetical protein FACS1894102_4470 [Spirochaetia bacterium]